MKTTILSLPFIIFAGAALLLSDKQYVLDLIVEARNDAAADGMTQSVANFDFALRAISALRRFNLHRIHDLADDARFSLERALD